MSLGGSRARLVRTLLGAVLFVALAAGGVGLGMAGWRLIDEDDGSEASASTPATDTGAAPETVEPAPAEPTAVGGEEAWPMFGLDVRRTGARPDLRLPPPFKRVWSARARSLLEFPPVVAYGRLFVGTNRGLVLALDAETGKEVWRRNTRRCIAASPAVGDGMVYVSLMDSSPCAVHDETEPGFLIAFDAETGERAWRFQTGVNESSPLLVDGTLYFGTWDGSVYALDAGSRRPLWTYETNDKVKGGAAFARGTIFIGSYDGNLYALDAQTGEERWVATPGSAVYATPVVSAGRVYVGATGGGVYAYDVEDGSLEWSQGTGDAVYSSAAVSRGTVFVGSYDGNLYALDGRTGEVRWTFAAGGPISGSPTVIGGIVYVSTLEGRTWGLRVSNGRQRFSYPAGQYTPVVADESRIYLTGYSRVYALEPR